VTLVFLTSTGLLLHGKLPPGSGRASIWGLTRHEWGDIHLVLACTFIVLIVLHLGLHWHR